MQFLLKLVFSHNPLTVIEDDHFYRLPSLKFLDLGGTEVTPNILEDLLKISLQLKTLILPKKMSCCLCHIQDDIEILCDTVKLDCTDSCATNFTLCEKDETMSKMQEDVIKILETRKLNASSILSIVPEKPLHDNVTLALSATEGRSQLDIRFHKLPTNLFKSVKGFKTLNTGDLLNVKWADQSELKKLYLLANLLQVALKEKIAEDERASQGGSKVQTEEPVEGSSAGVTLQKEGHLRKVKREIWLGKNPRWAESFLRVGRERRQFAKVAMQHAEQPTNPNLHAGPQIWRKLAEGLEPQSVASFLRLHRAALQSSSKRSVLQSPTESPPLTASILVDENPEDLTGKVVIILKHSNKSRKANQVEDTPVGKEAAVPTSQNSPSERNPDLFQNEESGENSVEVLRERLESEILKKEELLSQLMKGELKSKIPADDSETSLNELSPDITLSHETHWEHHEQRTTTSPRLQLLPAPGDYLLQGDLFESELNKRLESLIPNAPVRNLISHVIRILKMDCTEPTIQMACAKLISRTGLLMKLFSERENIKETTSLWKSYFWSTKNVPNMTTASPRKMGKPSDEIARQGIPEYGYGNKLLLAISVTAVIMIIIAVICLIEICSQRSAAKSRDGSPHEKRTFLGRKKKGAPEKKTSGSSVVKPLWLTDMYQPVDKIRTKNLVGKLHDEEYWDEEDQFNWAKSRPSAGGEPPPEKASSKIVEEPPVKKASSKKLVPEKEEVPTGSSKPESSGEEDESASKKPSSAEEGEAEEEEEDE
ncbi:leucine-rich repeat-containing protein 37A-like [Rhineura floridana]|uniref:leucine-rich repeat-containing protein 37A-like n=1 Tax=Rhineura floridana TaxID=261503 RepID=UPI002AC843FD|nr:leucine-rich repeat-containing protein 37A-like [Rhineura floridana]